MSEKIHVKVEAKSPRKHAEVEKPLEQTSEREKQHLENQQEQVAELAQAKAEQLAVSGQEKALPDGAEQFMLPPSSPSLKAESYRTTMRRIEAKLPVYERAFSRIIHNPTIDTVSNVASKTVARPSGLLGAGLVATAGLAFVLYYAKSLGFALSGSEFAVLIAAGWLAGITVELVGRQFRRR